MNLLKLRGQWVHFGTIKSVWISFYGSIQTVQREVPRSSKFTCHFSYLLFFIIYLHSSTKVFSTSGTSYWRTDSSVKSISALTFVAKCLRLVYTICVNSLIVTLLTSILVFSNSDILIVLIPCYPLPSLNWTLKLPLGWSAASYVEIVKRCLPKYNIIGQYDHYPVY